MLTGTSISYVISDIYFDEFIKSCKERKFVQVVDSEREPKVVRQAMGDSKLQIKVAVDSAIAISMDEKCSRMNVSRSTHLPKEEVAKKPAEAETEKKSQAETPKKPKKAILFLSADHCVRLYCGKEVKQKVRTKDGHGRFFPASYDEKNKVYFVDKTTFSDVLKKDCGGSGESSLWGTKVTKIPESVSPWVTVKPKEDVIYRNPACDEGESK